MKDVKALKVIIPIIPTNRLLSLMGKADSDLCSFCGTEAENLYHLFWECAVTSTFILEVERVVLSKQFFFSKEDFLLGYGKGGCHPYNFLILHMKYFIFDSKRNNRKPNINDFSISLKPLLREQDLIAVES